MTATGARRLRPNFLQRLGIALALATPALIFGVVVTRNTSGLSGATPASDAVLVIVTILVRILAGGALVGAIVLIALGSRMPGAPRAVIRATVGMILVGVVLLALAAALPSIVGLCAIVFIIMLALVPRALRGALGRLLALVGDYLPPQQAPASRRRMMSAVIPSALVLLAVVGLGIAVTVGESRDVHRSVFALVVWAVFWVVLGVVVISVAVGRSAAAATVARALTPRRIVLLFLWIASVALLSHAFVAAGSAGTATAISVAAVTYALAGVAGLCLAAALTIIRRDSAPVAVTLRNSRRAGRPGPDALR